MTDANRPVSSYADPVNRAEARHPAPMTDAERRSPGTTGPLLDSMDWAAFAAAAVITLGPLAMAAFWAPYH